MPRKRSRDATSIETTSSIFADTADNSLLKRVTGLGRLRVRGKPSVFMAMMLKVEGWNILQASLSRKRMKALIGLFTSLTRRCMLNAMPRCSRTNGKPKNHSALWKKLGFKLGNHRAAKSRTLCLGLDCVDRQLSIKDHQLIHVADVLDAELTQLNVKRDAYGFALQAKPWYQTKRCCKSHAMKNKCSRLRGREVL